MENFSIKNNFQLKHSGTNDEDLKVSYVDGDNKEIPIKSQNDFQVALYYFRQRARASEIITLKLAHKSGKIMNKKQNLNDAETQVDGNMKNTAVQENRDFAPDWFLQYMKQVCYATSKLI